MLVYSDQHKIQKGIKPKPKDIIYLKVLSRIIASPSAEKTSMTNPLYLLDYHSKKYHRIPVYLIQQKELDAALKALKQP